MNKYFIEHNSVTLDDGNIYEYDIIEKTLSVKDVIKMQACGYRHHDVTTYLQVKFADPIQITVHNAYINLDRHKLYIDTKELEKAFEMALKMLKEGKDDKDN